MSDKSAIERLREMLDERGVEYKTDDRNGLRETIWCGVAAFQLSPTAKMTMIVTPEQAIDATLGIDRHPYEQRITGDGSDWGEIMRNAYDDLMANACESCTPEQMRQLTDYIRSEMSYEDSLILLDELGVSERTCHIVEYIDSPISLCSECGAVQPDDFTVYYCWNCGAKVVGE